MKAALMVAMGLLMNGSLCAASKKESAAVTDHPIAYDSVHFKEIRHWRRVENKDYGFNFNMPSDVFAAKTGAVEAVTPNDVSVKEIPAGRPFQFVFVSETASTQHLHLFRGRVVPVDIEVSVYKAADVGADLSAWLKNRLAPAELSEKKSSAQLGHLSGTMAVADNGLALFACRKGGHVIEIRYQAMGNGEPSGETLMHYQIQQAILDSFSF